MKKHNTIIVALFVAFTAMAQNKKQLQQELYNYSKSVVMNKAYDKPYADVYNAVYIVMSKEYPNVTKSEKNKNEISGEAFHELYRENLSMEIIGNGPYRVVFKFRKTHRNYNPNGGYTAWFDVNEIPENYSYKIQYQLYAILNDGGHLWPQALKDKVQAYNSKQKKDKNKLVQGIDW